MNLRERVESLTPKQRQTLAQELSRRNGGPARLVAHLSVTADTSAEEMREFSASKLPDYMTPSQFVFVDQLPRTPAGKLDRRALAAPEQEGPVEISDAVEARTPAEALLLELWKEVIGVDEVGIHDDFFEIGGDSLLSIRLLARASKEGLEIAPEAFFEQPTVAGMAAIAAPATSAAAAPDESSSKTAAAAQSRWLVSIQSEGSARPLVVVPGIGGNPIGLPVLARAFGEEQPVLGLRSKGLNDGEEPLETIEEIADEFVRDWPAFPDGFNLLGICSGAAVAFEMAKKLATRGSPPRRLALLDPAILLMGKEGAPAAMSFVRSRLRLYWDELREADWHGRGALVAKKAAKAAQLLAQGGLEEETLIEARHHRVTEANRQAVLRYVPGNYEGAARIFMTLDRELGDRPDWRLEWQQRITPRPEVCYIEGRDSGDAIGAKHAGDLASKLRSWFD